MKSRFILYWIIWTLLGALLMYSVVSSDKDISPPALYGIICSFAPLLGIMLALGAPKGSTWFKEWLIKDKNSIYYIAGGLTLLFAIPGLFTNSFDPYYSIIFLFIVLAIFGVLKQNSHPDFKLSWSDLSLWMLLWIPFDLRWYNDMQAHLDYNWWAMAISVIAIIGWYGYRGANIGYNLVPKLKDFPIAIVALLMITALTIPPGLITDFLTFSIPETYDVPKLAAHFLGLFLTVALPEELFFRGILYKGLENVSSKKWVPMVVSSLAFGLMHWNNVSDLSMQLTYITLATFAGMGYAWAYKKSGNSLFAAILTHTLVDWVWKLFLAG